MDADKEITIKEQSRTKSKINFFKLFPKGFRDKNYLTKKRDRIWNAHLHWNELLNQEKFGDLLAKQQYFKIIQIASEILLKSGLLVSTEKKSIQYILKNKIKAKTFSSALYDSIYGEGTMETRFENFVNILVNLSDNKIKLATWHTASVFAFVADPVLNILLKPKITLAAAKKYNYKEFDFISTPNWATYKSLLNFAERIYLDLKKEQPLDMIDIQSFITIMGSRNYK